MELTSSPTRTLRRDAAENRERLLAAASEVFSAQGPDASVEDIARAAGVGMGTLYRRFPTKQDLIDELIGGRRAEMAAAALRSLEESDETCLPHLLEGACTAVFDARGYSQRLWFSTAAGSEHMETFRAALGVALGRAQAAGVARVELTVADLYMILWAIRGIVDQVASVAPHGWRRHLEVLLIGLRPGPALTEPALSVKELTEIQAEQRASAQAPTRVSS